MRNFGGRTGLKPSIQDGLVELGGFVHRLRIQLFQQGLAATVILFQGRLTLPQMAEGAHRQPVGILTQPIAAQQAQGSGQRSLVVSTGS